MEKHIGERLQQMNEGIVYKKYKCRERREIFEFQAVIHVENNGGAEAREKPRILQ